MDLVDVDLVDVDVVDVDVVDMDVVDVMLSRVAIVTCGGCMLLLLPGSSIDNIHSMMNTLVSYMHHT